MGFDGELAWTIIHEPASLSVDGDTGHTVLHCPNSEPRAVRVPRTVALNGGRPAPIRPQQQPLNKHLDARFKQAGRAGTITRWCRKLLTILFDCGLQVTFHR